MAHRASSNAMTDRNAIGKINLQCRRTNNEVKIAKLQQFLLKNR
jgi:hypothetical protein